MRPARVLLLLPVFATLVAMGSSTPAGGATAGTVVGATIPSATTLTTTACASGTANVTEFGSVLPGSPAVTSSDCVVTFGSSNDTARLEVRQRDARGSAMFRPAGDHLDPTFGTGGISLQPYPAGVEEMKAVDVDSQGRVIQVGRANAGGTDRLTAVRFLANGTTDFSYDSDGASQWPVVGTGLNVANDLVVLPDDSVIVAGQVQDGNFDAVLVKWRANGTLETAFGSGGVVRLDVTTGRDDVLRSLVLLPDGSVLAAGYTNRAATNNDLLFVKANATTGALDGSYGTGGVLTNTLTTGPDELMSLDRALDGTIVGSGRTEGTGPDALALRLRSDLVPDPTFSGDGFASFHVGGTNGDYVNDVAALDDGRVLVHGMRNMGTGSDMFVLRTSATGTLDTTFAAPTGYALVDFGTWDGGGGVYVQPDDGGIVVAGLAGGATDAPGIARLLASGSPDTSFGTSGKLTLSFGAGAGRANGITGSWDGSLIVVGTGNANGDGALAKFAAPRIPDWQDGSADWDQGTAGAFGACLRAVGAGTTNTWPLGTTCPSTDGTFWKPVPASAPSAIATAASGTTTASASLRFGFRPGGTTPSGRYVAPIVFSVVAPG